MNWNAIDLNSSEAGMNLIENLTFSALLLEIECNLPEINEATIRAQFEKDLQSRMNEAREIFTANLANITAHARNYRGR